MSASSALTRQLINKTSSLRWQTAPPAVKSLIKACVLDFLGVSLAAVGEPAATALRDYAVEKGGSHQSTLIGSSQRVPIEEASLVNGTIGHLLDYDDVNFAILGHPTVAVLPAILALGEFRRASGAEMMDAFLTGYEMACRVGLSVAPGHYNRGFHATGTIGSFGAAAGCARLLCLDEKATAYALGIAGTRTSGVKAMFGTSCKPLHAGLAAANGVFAACLALRGFDSREDVLEARQGFAATHSPDFNADAALADPEGGLHLYNNLFKFHAACYETQSTIECARAIRSENALSASDIHAVRVRVNVHCNEICNISEPKSGLETKFSLRSTAAFALSGLDTSMPSTFSDENAAKASLVALRDKVEVQLTSELSLTESEVEVQCTDGRVFQAKYDSGHPIQDAAERDGRVAEKFNAMVTPLLGAQRTESIVAAVARMEEWPDVQELLHLCRL